jgi:MoxR-like ATPase
MATQNPVEMDGTYPLPEAQLDRFLLKVEVLFPSAEELVDVAERTTGAHTATASAVCDSATLRSMIALVREVPVPDHVTRYAVDLVVASHPDQPGAPSDIRNYVRFGASPRGVQALILSGKANALIEGRPNVSTDDVRKVAKAALRHRLVLGYEATADGVSANTLIESVMGAVTPAGSGVRGAR